MKPLLRTVLFVDALITLAFGLLFIATPWTSLFDALQLIPPDPAMVGQLFGVALLGLAWLQWHATVNGAMTLAVARVTGFVNCLSGLLVLVWLVAFRKPPLSGLGQFVGPAVGIVVLLIGLIQVRMAGAVRRRERALAVTRATERTPTTPVSRTEPTVGRGSVQADRPAVAPSDRPAPVPPPRSAPQPFDPAVDPARPPLRD